MFAFNAISSVWPKMMTQEFNAAAVTIGARLAGAAAQVIAGHLGDLYGRKRAFSGFLSVWIAGFALIALSAAIQRSPFSGNIRTWPLDWAYIAYWIGDTNLALFGVWFNEVVPTDVRSLGVSFSYVVGRSAGVITPVLVSILAPTMRLAGAMAVGIPAVVISLIVAATLPETLGRRLHAVEIAAREGVVAVSGAAGRDHRESGAQLAAAPAPEPA